MKSQQVQAAAQIRKILKQEFPGVKFKVTSEGYSMGDNVNVSFVDGPTEAQVKEKIGHHQYGHFDGMIDSYESSNRIDSIPQTKFLFINRNISKEKKQAAVNEIVKKYQLPDDSDQSFMVKFNCWKDQKIYEYFYDLSFA